MDTLYLVMPAYNEEANIRKTVEQWYPILNGKSALSRLVIADSGSIDATHAILTAMQAEYPALEILSDTGKQHGPKVIALYRYAIEHGADYVFQTDSDGQTDPDEFAAFWDMRDDYDGIFGNRTVRGDGEDRAFVERVVCLLVEFFFHASVPDANAPFRLMRADVLKKYIYQLDSDFNLPNILMVAFFVHGDERVCFREISFKPRQGGVNSLNIPKIIKIGFKALGDFRRYSKLM